jgi:hypothetical protein
MADGTLFQPLNLTHLILQNGYILDVYNKNKKPASH